METGVYRSTGSVRKAVDEQQILLHQNAKHWPPLFVAAINVFINLLKLICV